MNSKKRSQQIHSTPMYIGGREKPTGLSKDYIVGLTDGEVCFYVETRSLNGIHKSSRVEMHFFIKLREDDLSLVQKVQEFFDCGGVYYQKEYRANQKNCYRFGVTAQKDLHEKIIPFFDKNPLKSQKVKNYLLFRQIAFMVKDGEHRTSEGLETIRQLKSQMNRGARWVPEIGSPSGNSKLPKLSKSARQGSKVGGS